MALAQPEHNEFIERYNATQVRDGIFRLRRLRDDARMSYKRDGDPIVGMIWAMCELDMGNFTLAEDLLKDFLVQIPIKPGTYLSDLLYINYARLLAHTGRFQQATELLNNFFSVLNEEAPITLNWVMAVYAEADQLDKAYQVFEQYAKLYPDTSINLINPSLMSYYLKEGEQGLFEAALHTYARFVGFKDLNLDNLDAFVDKMAEVQTHPRLKPNLWDGEFERITQIESQARALLKEDDAWENAVMPEVIRRQNDLDDEIISFDDVVKSLGLENIV